MRLVLSRLNGVNPMSCGTAGRGEPGEFVESDTFINTPAHCNYSINTRCSQAAYMPASQAAVRAACGRTRQLAAERTESRRQACQGLGIWSFTRKVSQFHDRKVGAVVSNTYALRKDYLGSSDDFAQGAAALSKDTKKPRVSWWPTNYWARGGPFFTYLSNQRSIS